MKYEEVTRTAPAYWASYLINGDATGFDYSDNAEAEQKAADAFIADVGLGAPVSCSEEEFMSFPDYGMAGDCCTYTFLRRIEE